MDEKSEMQNGEQFAPTSTPEEIPAEYRKTVRKEDGSPFTGEDLRAMVETVIPCIEEVNGEIRKIYLTSNKLLSDNPPPELDKTREIVRYAGSHLLTVMDDLGRMEALTFLSQGAEELERRRRRQIKTNRDAINLLDSAPEPWIKIVTLTVFFEQQGSNPDFADLFLMDFVQAAFDIENGWAVREGPYFDYVEQERRAYLSGVHEDRYVMQGPGTNLFTKTNVKRNTKRNQDKRAKTDIQTTEVRDTSAKSNVALVSLNMDPSNWASKVGNITVSSLQLFDIIGAQSKKTNSPRITMEISEYMKLRGLTRLQTAREQVQRDLNTLYNVSLDYRDNNGEYGTNGSIRLISAQFVRNGVFQATLSLELWEYMQSKSFPMYIPPQLYEINSHKNPHSYYLLRKICEHKNMNRGKPNEDLIAVKTLLGAASGIPTVEEVRKLDRNTKERIIVPFERDMNELTPTLQWEYCHNKGKSLTRSELDGMDFTLFQTLMIRIKWVYYPEQSKKSDSATSQLS